jgi:hypothetical protein
MKFLADENISHLTVKFLKELGYDAKGVLEYLKVEFTIFLREKRLE